MFGPDFVSAEQLRIKQHRDRVSQNPSLRGSSRNKTIRSESKRESNRIELNRSEFKRNEAR